MTEYERVVYIELLFSLKSTVAVQIYYLLNGLLEPPDRANKWVWPPRVSPDGGVLHLNISNSQVTARSEYRLTSVEIPVCQGGARTVKTAIQKLKQCYYYWLMV